MVFNSRNSITTFRANHRHQLAQTSSHGSPYLWPVVPSLRSLQHRKVLQNIQILCDRGFPRAISSLKIFDHKDIIQCVKSKRIMFA